MNLFTTREKLKKLDDLLEQQGLDWTEFLSEERPLEDGLDAETAEEVRRLAQELLVDEVMIPAGAEVRASEPGTSYWVQADLLVYL